MVTVNELFDKYSSWCAKHKSPRTLEWYANYLNNFLAYPGIAELDAMALKPFHIIEWTDSKPTWGDTYKRGAIVAVQRVYNWAEEMGYIESTPLKKIKKPQAKRRETYMTPVDFYNILALLSPDDPFRTLITFVWLTGCRPQEVRHIEPRHIELDKERIVFPAIESKGKRDKRIIYLQGESLNIIKSLLADQSGSGKLFLNNRGTPWTKYAICNRFHRLSKRLGKKMFCYAMRHGFGTRKLIQGHDCITVATLMGHKDGSMLATIYSHVDQNHDHLKKALAD